MTDNSLKDLLDQKIEIPMKKGKKAIIGSMDLETMCWITEKYGSFEKFQERFSSITMDDFPEVSELVFALLENQEDFTSLKDFRKNFSILAVDQLTTALETCLYGSLPDIKESEGEAGESGK